MAELDSQDGWSQNGGKGRTPCFLLSSARGGSTLVTRVLDSHSRIASPCEICVPYIVRPSWKFIKSLRNLRTISDYYGCPSPGLSLQLAFRGAARANMDCLAAAILHKEQKQALVVKDPRHASYVDRIEQLYDDEKPRYILLYRDARSVAHSFFRKLKRKLDRGFRVWREAVRGMQACEQAFPERCLSVRFEDLLSNPQGAMTDVVRFLGYDYESSMLDYGRSAHTDQVLNLWRDQRLNSSVNNAGAILPADPWHWRDDAELIHAYRARNEIVQLNERLGYAA